MSTTYHLLWRVILITSNVHHLEIKSGLSYLVAARHKGQISAWVSLENGLVVEWSLFDQWVMGSIPGQDTLSEKKTSSTKSEKKRQVPRKKNRQVQNICRIWKMSHNQISEGGDRFKRDKKCMYTCKHMSIWIWPFGVSHLPHGWGWKTLPWICLHAHSGQHEALTIKVGQCNVGSDVLANFWIVK